MKLLKQLITVVLFMTLSVASAQEVKQQLVDLKSLEKSFVIDLKYATTDNFLKKAIYTQNTVAQLVPEAAEALLKVQKELKQHGLGLKIWDAYRPMSAQEAMWEIKPDPRYISNPKQGGRHTRGTAVDLTLIDLVTSKELQMPTEFDEFSEKAHRTNHYSDPVLNANMKLLDQVMHKHGFSGFQTEWWHYDYKNWQDYPVIKS